jgi:L-amino acid N-acyltransferase YncA
MSQTDDLTKIEKLKDGTNVIIRPMQSDDLDRSFAFFQKLPEEDRIFLRVDVTKREFVEQRIRAINRGAAKRIVAIINDKIVADGALELADHGWKEHVGELRLIVARAYQRKGLGMLMARQLYSLAVSEKVEEIVVRMMRPQDAAHSIFKRLGFHEEVLLPDYVKDLGGRRHDMIFMRCNIEELWQELEDYFGGFDWRRMR